MRDFMKQLKNKITRKYRNKPSKVNYLNYPTNPKSPEDRFAKCIVINQCSHLFGLFVCLFVFNYKNTRAKSSISECSYQNKFAVFKVPNLNVDGHTEITTQLYFFCRLHELEDGIDQETTWHSSYFHASPQSDSARPTQVEVEITSSHPPSRSTPPVATPAQPPPLALSPRVEPVTPAKANTRDLEEKFKMDRRIIELQGKHQAEAKARRQLEKDLSVMEESRMEDREAMCELEQTIHDLEESNKLYKERVSQLLATPPLVNQQLGVCYLHPFYILINYLL